MADDVAVVTILQPLTLFLHSRLNVISTSILSWLLNEYSLSASSVDARRTYVDVRQIAAETGPVLFLWQPPYVDVRCVNATIEINVFYMNVDVRQRRRALCECYFSPPVR